MATTIINPGPGNNSSESGGMGMLIGGFVLFIVVVLFFVYAFPYMRGMMNGGNGVQVNVPKTVDVNVKQSK